MKCALPWIGYLLVGLVVPLSWPPKSPDLTPLDLYCGDYWRMSWIAVRNCRNWRSATLLNEERTWIWLGVCRVGSREERKRVTNVQHRLPEDTWQDKGISFGRLPSNTGTIYCVLLTSTYTWMSRHHSTILCTLKYMLSLELFPDPFLPWFCIEIPYLIDSKRAASSLRRPTVSCCVEKCNEQ